MSLSEYLNRKKSSSTAAGKRESFPGTSSDVSSPSQSLVTENTSSTDPVSSMLVNYRAASSSGACSTFTTSLCSSVSSSTGGALIEPVSPDDGYSAEDDRPVLHTIRQGMPLHRQRKRTGCTCIGYVIKILIKPLIMHL